MEYKYYVCFKLANDEMANCINFKDEKYRKRILEAIEHYNRAGASAKNVKQIYDKKIQSNSIILYFSSKQKLENPTKSFRYFSKYLVDTQEFNPLVARKRLLRGVEAREIQGENQDMGETGEISDEKMLTTLIHWCMSKEVEDIEDKKNKRRIIKMIKELLSECEI